jgi:hypothetical protein
VVKSNPDVRAVPRLVSFSPYQRGWVAILKPEATWQSKLMTGQHAARWLREEVGRLEQLGGLPSGKASAASSRQTWSVLKKAFFTRAVGGQAVEGQADGDQS